jgi:mono/diheme cytochrome c family protein
MRKLFAIAGIAALCMAGSIAHAQDIASGETTYQAKCASCHGANAAGRFLRAPSIKGKTAEKIEKKEHALKRLSADDIKNVGAYLATLQ